MKIILFIVSAEAGTGQKGRIYRIVAIQFIIRLPIYSKLLQACKNFIEISQL